MIGELWQAAVLGAVQGVTEFLPISSSAHLVIVPEILGWPAATLTFDVAVHWATALAVVLYFRSDWARLARSTVASLRSGSPRDDPNIRLLALLALATIPALVAGLLFKEPFEAAILHEPRDAARLASLLLLATGALLLVSDQVGRRALVAEQISTTGAVGVGCAQAAAVLPGISRSGATIAAGLLAGLRREEAARFSFLLSAPVVLAAGVVQLADLAMFGGDTSDPLALLVGFATSFVVGYLAIDWLLSYLRRAPLTVFVAYTWIGGALAFAVLSAR
jgi:undecaprenyl-diphosphatase